MFNSFKELSHKRKEWVRINKENDFEEGIRKILTDLYPDNAHFIYELLQNAEDAEASTVNFILAENEMFFVHNGKKLFTLENVESITSIGRSSKIDDPTRIGKFGVGFKSVFVYTDTPEIHSGNFHFCIKDLVIPENIESLKMNDEETIFRFPFNNKKKDRRKAIEEIENG